MLEHESADGAPLFGVAAEFNTAEALLAAARAMRDRELGRIDTYTPMPVPEVEACLAMRGNRMAGVASLAWVVGACGFFAMAVYATVYDYRFNVGGRPLLSWPYYIVPSFAAGILVAAVSVTLALLAKCRLPRLNHPAFNIERFETATQDRFWLCVEANEDRFDADAVEAVMQALPLPPLSVQRVPR